MFGHSILSFLRLHSKLWFTIKIKRVQIKKTRKLHQCAQKQPWLCIFYEYICATHHSAGPSDTDTGSRASTFQTSPWLRGSAERRGPLSCSAQAGGQKTRHAWLIYWAIQPESTRPYLHSHLSVSAQGKICLLNLNDWHDCFYEILSAAREEYIWKWNQPNGSFNRSARSLINQCNVSNCSRSLENMSSF